MDDPSAPFLALLGRQPVVPVIKIDRLEHAVPLARALAAGGLPLIEITMRTPVALDAIRAVRDEVPEAVVGAGTILNPRHYKEAAEAGAAFIVSPGITASLLDTWREFDLPYLPGVITPGEMMLLMEAGFTLAKFFPAEQAGGAAFLKSLAAPLAGLRFCPTGGVSAENAATYFGLPNVVCVGGSWVAPDKLLAEERWDDITALARAAAAIRG